MAVGADPPVVLSSCGEIIMQIMLSATGLTKARLASLSALLASVPDPDASYLNHSLELKLRLAHIRTGGRRGGRSVKLLKGRSDLSIGTNGLPVSIQCGLPQVSHEQIQCHARLPEFGNLRVGANPGRLHDADHVGDDQ